MSISGSTAPAWLAAIAVHQPDALAMLPLPALCGLLTASTPHQPLYPCN